MTIPKSYAGAVLIDARGYVPESIETGLSDAPRAFWGVSLRS